MCLCPALRSLGIGGIEPERLRVKIAQDVLDGLFGIAAVHRVRKVGAHDGIGGKEERDVPAQQLGHVFAEAHKFRLRRTADVGGRRGTVRLEYKGDGVSAKVPLLPAGVGEQVVAVITNARTHKGQIAQTVAAAEVVYRVTEHGSHENIAAALEKRTSFRRAMKQSLSRAMKAGAKGIKVKCSGRLGGAEIARTEGYNEGSTPLQTIRADIEYGFAEAKTTYGRIGVKVWIYKGEVLNRRARKA